MIELCIRKLGIKGPLRKRVLLLFRRLLHRIGVGSIFMSMTDMIIKFRLITCCQSTGLTCSGPTSQDSPSLIYEKIESHMPCNSYFSCYFIKSSYSCPDGLS